MDSRNSDPADTAGGTAGAVAAYGAAAPPLLFAPLGRSAG